MNEFIGTQNLSDQQKVGKPSGLNKNMINPSKRERGRGRERERRQCKR